MREDNKKTPPPLYPLDRSEKGYVLTPAMIRAIVAEEVHKALYGAQDGKVVVPASAQVMVVVADDGTVWRGTLHTAGEQEA